MPTTHVCFEMYNTLNVVKISPTPEHIDLCGTSFLTREKHGLFYFYPQTQISGHCNSAQRSSSCKIYFNRILISSGILPRWDETVKELCSHTRGVNCTVCWSYRDICTINMYIYIYLFGIIEKENGLRNSNKCHLFWHHMHFTSYAVFSWHPWALTLDGNLTENLWQQSSIFNNSHWNFGLWGSIWYYICSI